MGQRAQTMSSPSEDGSGSRWTSEESQTEQGGVEAGDGKRRRGVSELCMRVYRSASAPLEQSLPCSSLKRVATTMAALRDALETEEATPECQTVLLCVGIGLWKRLHCGAGSETDAALIAPTMALLFSLLVMMAGPPPDDPTEDTGDTGGAIDMFAPAHTVEIAAKAAQKREEETLMQQFAATTITDRAFLVASDDANMTMGAASRAVLLHARRRAPSASLQEMTALAGAFFKASSAAAIESLLDSTQEDFISLAAASEMEDALKRKSELLLAIVAAAESEAGQAVLRDLLLSFRLPAEVIGVRRGLSIGRETNLEITRNHALTLNDAHNSALAGAEHTWSHGDDVERACALLAGWACVLSTSGGSSDDALDGRVDLPCFSTRCRPGVKRLALVSQGTWIVYRVRSTDGKPQILARQRGFTGFCLCLLYASR